MTEANMRMSVGRERGTPSENSARPSRSHRRGLALILVLCVAALVVSAYVLDVGLIDDSYIFLRYARNIAEGHGAVFNLGERVEGYSSPLWTFILGATVVLIPDFETLAVVLGLCCGAGVVIVLLITLRSTFRLGHWDITVLGLGVATSPALVFWSASGMDAALFLLLVTTSLVSILKDRNSSRLSARTATLLVLATLTRPEGVLLAVYAGMFFLYERRSVRVLIGYAVAVAALLLLRYTYYGVWLPNTYHAKVTFDLTRRLSDGATYVLTGVRTHLLLTGVMLVMATVAWWRRRRTETPVVFLCGWVALWGSYVLYVGGDNFAMFRFLLSVLPALFLLLAWGWSYASVGWRQPARLACLSVVLAAFGVSGVQAYRDQAPSYYYDVGFARAWGKVGRWLERHTPPDTVVAAIVPGALGYHSRRPIIDMLGLTDRMVSLHGSIYPEAAHGHARYYTDYIFDRRPDLVVYHSSGRFPDPVYKDPSRISLLTGFALYDFVTDARCAEHYAYDSVSLDDGTWVEMLRKRPSDSPPLALKTR